MNVEEILESIQRAKYWHDFRIGLLLGFLLTPVIIVFLIVLL